MPLLISLLPLLAQVGPYAGASNNTILNTPRVEGRDVPRQKPVPRALDLPPSLVAKGSKCQLMLEEPDGDPVTSARGWAAGALAADRADAEGCLGMAEAQAANWDAAEAALMAARDASPATDHAARASYGAMAGNAALAGGHAGRSLLALDTARSDAQALEDDVATGQIELDRARALVALRRPADARLALDNALSGSPQDSDAWLLSATLYRREKQYGPAQSAIEKAAAINNGDPAIALEAGVIAMLSGREGDARKSWASAVALAPGSPEGLQASAYLKQIGADTPAAPPAVGR